MHFTNPVLNADWPDPDVVRVGDDYFMVVSSDPDHGIFVLSAEDPRGPWSQPRLLLGGTRLIDPCPLWKDIFGPYEGRVVLAQGRGVFGRVVHLQPMTWRTDGWPVIGAAGEPVPTHRRPQASAIPQREPERSDDFTATTLGLQWHWQANPEPDWLALPGDGTLRLRVLPDDVGDLRLLPRVLGQPLPGRPSEWTTSLTLGPASPGTRAGTAGRWIGADIGLFAAAPLGTPDNHGYATFGAVSVELVGAEEEAV